MLTVYRILLVVMVAVLAACGQGPAEQAPADSSQHSTPTGVDTEPSWREERAALGRATYQQNCAGCHDSGEQDAPRLGQRADWSGRSQMWQAVLSRHAKAGYLDMPGKGGHPELSDEAVEAATEYMLGQTFPERPLD